MVGGFIFLDHMGPTTLAAGSSMDVPPHPHINLATVTYLFSGEVMHRDSLGSEQLIRPGAINWMTAGRGVVHSERTPAQLRDRDMLVHGLQAWVALPSASEEVAPDFTHYPAGDLPQVHRDGAALRVLIGEAFGERSPVATLSALVYVDVSLSAGAVLPVETDYPERAVYVVSGGVECAGERLGEAELLVLSPGEAELRAVADTRLVILGGEPIDGPRHIWWNFVSSSAERLEQAKAAWRAGPGQSDRFGEIPGDADEFVPLPER